MSASSEFRRILEACDARAARAAWARLAPGMPQPESDADALIVIHRARTEARSMPLRARAYSHRWLLDHGIPSGLPDELLSRAERLYPKIVEGVGIMALFPQPHTPIVQAAMRDAVNECYADRRTEPAFVKARMMEAREREKRLLLG